MTEETLFEQARLLPIAERAAFLNRECRGDPQLHARVVALLAADSQPLDATQGLNDPNATGVHLTIDQAPTRSHDPNATTGYLPSTTATGSEPTEKIIARRYRLIKAIGEGGMGSVYLAEQSEPVKRQVALKLIKVGMDSRSVLARFEAERQALALMDHPNIARIYDGGVTEHGQPFFVMELVHGVPLTEYCDQKRLSVEARLQLFVQVCTAVQHAHQKGIIHRDLKPGNVLVTEVDDRPVCKVIDFGVAKATEQKLTDLSFADTGMIVGTPAYMSPEQADPSSSDIDTRTDVYSLGVMLYELLTGTPPIDSNQFKRGAILEMLRMVREVEPPKPSTRLSTADALPNIASDRSIEPGKLRRLLQGELDWVVMKALEKDRNRRYDTANGLARDLQRYLADEMVEARPPSRGYRLQKFVRRNKLQVIAAGLVFLTLVAGIIGTTWGLIQADRAEGVARRKADDERQQRERAEEAETDARKRLAQVERGIRLLTGVFAKLDYRRVRESKERVEVLLSRELVEAAKQLENDSVGNPLAVAQLQCELGLSLLHLGHPKEASELFVKAKAAWKAAGEFDTATVLVCTNNLAVCYLELGRLKEAIALYEEILPVQRKRLGSTHAETLMTLGNLALAYDDLGMTDKSRSFHEETVQGRRQTLGADHPDTITSINNLATHFYISNKRKEALPLFRETFERRSTLLGKDHPDTFGAAINLAACLRDLGKVDESLPILEDVVRRQKIQVGLDHPDTLSGMNNLAYTYNLAGRTADAISVWEETVKRRTTVLGKDHPDTISCMNFLARTYERTQQLERSLPLRLAILETARTRKGAIHPETLDAAQDLAVAYCKAGKSAEAARLIGELLAEMRKRPAQESPELAGKQVNFALALLLAKAFPEAEPLLRESLAIREKFQPDAWTTFNTQSLLGGALLGQKKYAEAEPLLLKGYEGLKVREKTIPKGGGTRIPEALDRLIELYTVTKKPSEAKKYRDLRAKYPMPAEVAPMPREKK